MRPSGLYHAAVLAALTATWPTAGRGVEDATTTVRYLIDADGGESLNSKGAVVNEQGQRAGWFWSSDDGVPPPAWEQSTLRVYDGTSAWRSVMNDPDQYRNEQKPIQGWDRSDGARFFRFAFTAGPDMAVPKGWTNVTQWWQYGTSPPVGIWMYDDLQPRLRTKDDFGSATAANPRVTSRWTDSEVAADGVWHNYLVKIKWGTTDGELALWKWDGTDWVSKYSATNTYIGYHDAGMVQDNYTWKMGGYRATGQDTWDMFYDGMAYGTTRAEALAGFVGPVPSMEIGVPTGTVRTQTQAGHAELAGTTSVRKTGGGTLRLTASNGYSGETRVLEGALAITSTAALPGWNAPGRVFVSSGAALVVENSVSTPDVETILATGGFAPGSQIGFDTSAGNRTATPLSGGIGLRKAGTGTLSLTAGPNTFTGPTTVAAGTLRIPGVQTIVSNLRVDQGAQLHLDGGATLAGPVSVVGDRAVRALSGSSTVSGTLTLRNQPGTTLEVAAGATLTLSGTVVAEGTNSQLLATGGGDLRVTGMIVALGTSRGFGMAGPATVHLLARNTFAGSQFDIDQGTVVVNTLFDVGTPSSLGVAAGTINMTIGRQTTSTLRHIGGEAFSNRQVRLQSDIAGARSLLLADGTGRLTFTNPVFLAADSTASRQPQSLVIGGSGAGGIMGTISDNSAAAPISVVKEGAGEWILGGASTYSGATAVTSGRLTVDGDLSAARGPVTVEAGATLGGRGVVGGATVIRGGGGLAPGASPGTLGFAQGVTVAGGGIYSWDISDATGLPGQPGGWDLLQIAGVLEIAATPEAPVRIDLTSLAGTQPDLYGPAANFSATRDYRWTIASAAGGITGFAPEKFLINASPLGGRGGFANDLGSGRFTVAQTGDELSLVFTAGPGPGEIRIDVPDGERVTQAEAGVPRISGESAVEKTGAGTLVLDAGNTSSGRLTIHGGSVAITAAAAIDSFSVIDVAASAGLDTTELAGGYLVAAGQTLGGSGVIVGSVTFGGGATLSPGRPPPPFPGGSGSPAGARGALVDPTAVPEPGAWPLLLPALAWGGRCRSRLTGRRADSVADGFDGGGGRR